MQENRLETTYRLASLVDRVSDSFLTLDTSWRITCINQSAATAGGKTPEELLGSVFWDVYPEAIGSPFYAACLRCHEEQAPQYLETYDPRAERWYDNYFYPASDGISLLARDITERKKAEAEYERTQKRLQAIARVTGVVIGTAPLREQMQRLAALVCEAFHVEACVIRAVDGDDLLLVGSHGVPEASLPERMKSGWGISEVIMSRRSPLFIPDVNVHPVTAAIRGLQPNAFRFRSYAGAPLLIENRVIGIVGVYSDTPLFDLRLADLEHLQTIANHIAVALINDRLYREVTSQAAQLEEEMQERKRLEEQLLHAQKMEGIGRLAGGIAHDFNNLLAAIIGYNELALSAVISATPLHEDLLQVQRAAERAAILTRQLLAFARKQHVTAQVVDLSELTLEMDRMLRRLIGVDVDLVTIPTDDLWKVKADPGQIEQVLVNLVVNARDAMPSGGKITIQTSNVIFTAEKPSPSPELAPGEYVVLEVQDNGMGIEPVLLPHIFEPFFTTKEIGKGTGLGLATCYGIVKQSGGHIEVESTQYVGTRFRVYLPRTLAQQREASEDATTLPFGTETVLVVEDEPLVRQYAARILSNLGYSVLMATNGVEALEILESVGQDVDLLFTDMVMPRMTGTALAERVPSRLRRMKMLFASGYAEYNASEPTVLRAGGHLLQKPYTSAMLARAVRRVLDETKIAPQSAAK